MSIQWKDEYSVNVKLIDDQHKNFIKILNKIYDSLDNMQSANLNIIFIELISYINYHFTTEEKYFEIFDYEGKTEHEADHNKFRKKINELRQNFHENKVALTLDLADYLEDWLLNHINGMDKKYTKCFNDHGLS